MISIIIPIKDSAQNLNITLKSILSDEELFKRDYEVIICNDGNSSEINNAGKKWKSDGYNISNIPIEPAHGSYIARNKGINHSKGEYLFFFDVPLAIDRGWFLPFMNILTVNDYVAGDIKVKPEECKNISEKMYAATAFPVRSYFYEQHFGPTAFLGVRKSVFEQVGLFHEVFSGGDMEFGQRVHNAGLKMAFFDEFPAWHPPRNIKQQFRKKVRVYNGIRKLNEMNGDDKKDPASINSLWGCITAIFGNVVKFKRNRMYRTGLFSYPEYVMSVFLFWGIEFTSRIYSKLSK